MAAIILEPLFDELDLFFSVESSFGAGRGIPLLCIGREAKFESAPENRVKAVPERHETEPLRHRGTEKNTSEDEDEDEDEDDSLLCVSVALWFPPLRLYVEFRWH